MATTAELVSKMQADLLALKATLPVLPAPTRSKLRDDPTAPTTMQLITDANALQAAITQAQNALAAAQAQVTAAQAQVTTAIANAAASAKALFDDLEANGSVVTVDTSTTPSTVTMYTPVPPAGYQATVIRVAT